jgi:hypothetical protein
MEIGGLQILLPLYVGRELIKPGQLGKTGMEGAGTRDTHEKISRRR